MAITVSTQVTAQQASDTYTYCYLYEPLKVNIEDDETSTTVIFMDMTVVDISDGSIVDTRDEYGKWDVSSSTSLEVDLMKIVRQYHDANVYQLSQTSEIADATNIVVCEYKYEFLFYSNQTDSTSGTTIKKLPINGGRNFSQFVGTVGTSQVLTEAEVYGIDLTGRWKNYVNISQSLSDPTLTDSTPTITVTTETGAEFEPCGGMLIWKSRYGGWMYWGMDIAVETPKGSYEGSLNVGMFEANDNGNVYVEADYVSISNSYSYNLKAMTLEVDELKAVAGIANSPAIYYMKDSSATLELMRVTSVSAPISTLIGGGDFQVSLQSISSTSHKVR